MLDNVLVIKLCKLTVESRNQPDRATILLNKRSIHRKMSDAFLRMKLHPEYAQRREKWVASF